MASPPPCAGKRFGHQFASPGGPCLNGCGINQKELSKVRERLTTRHISIADTTRKTIHGMHTPTHDLARQISEWCGEPKQFGLYLGKVKWLGLQRSWSLWGKLKQQRTPIRNRAALFMALTRKDVIDPKGK